MMTTMMPPLWPARALVAALSGVVMASAVVHMCWMPRRAAAAEKALLIVVDLCPTWCGLGNQMFRYAAGLGLAAQNYTVCAFGLEDVDRHPWHRGSAFVLHVSPVGRRLEPCAASISRLRLPYLADELAYDPATMRRFRPPHSTYEPFRDDGRRPMVVVVSGYMQSFRYFHPHLERPFFRLHQADAARRWLAQEGLTSAVHIRRGDKLVDGSPAVPLDFYAKALRLIGTSRVAVCTDDPGWVRRQGVFANASIAPARDPGFDMAVLAEATDAVAIAIGTFGWWGAYLSKARRKYYFPTVYVGPLLAGYRESDYIPRGEEGQGDWVAVM